MNLYVLFSNMFKIALYKDLFKSFVSRDGINVVFVFVYIYAIIVLNLLTVLSNENCKCISNVCKNVGNVGSGGMCPH